MQKLINHQLFSSFYRYFSTTQVQCSRSGSSSIWLNRQSRDPYTRDARSNQFRARSAYKLIELNRIHRLFKPGMAIVDLGFAPGSWSQVAIREVGPSGKVIGVDLISTIPPPGVIGIQGDLLDPIVQQNIHNHLVNSGDTSTVLQDHKVADVILSDMMMNTSGIKLRDHQFSIDLCDAALLFCAETLKSNGSFVCKYYSGDQDSALEKRIKTLFQTVKRVKPGACRKESREAYFVGLKRKSNVSRQDMGF
ncbi:rRNA methyltransferase 2, mitochondrial [Neolecta irregularis DAH-3]|uniref:rRNA methyltransferase 2, mitochondrial n=1 Tax=Neolecta irregularis (strain DAH-3) TaxID=1198029 RepID=A0A1U7LI10_NEOID|nr:rRNA methyltransferase 2, mitochondrial [Neolecta irregularis DAH-3]|eukprot:OLL22233.1 rRNA methyltransferase 2, mitochondrial [Neolecta irregularis DAH-3]